MAQETACYGSQLQALLAEPEMVALLQSTPQAVALLRPLCRMLAATLPEAVEPAKVSPPKIVRRRFRPEAFPRSENWLGQKALRERWEARIAAAYLRQARGPPYHRG